MLRPVLRSEALLIKILAKLLEKFVNHALLYDLFITVYQELKGKKLMAVQDTLRRIMLADKVPQRDLAAQLQKCRFNLWASLH